VDCGLLSGGSDNCEPWVNVLLGLRTLLTFTHRQHINMSPYSRWMNDSFKQTLLDSCTEYMDTTDRGSVKTRSTLITRVAQDITAIAQAKNLELPDDLEKVNDRRIV